MVSNYYGRRVSLVCQGTVNDIVDLDRTWRPAVKLGAMACNTHLQSNRFKIPPGSGKFLTFLFVFQL